MARRTRTWMLYLAGATILLVTSQPAGAQCPPKTTVSDTLYNADGSPAAGRLVIAWPTFQAGSCQVVAGQVTVNVASGSFAVELYSNDIGTPSGTSYRVTYYLKSGRITTEYWVVPVSALPVPLATVRSASVPVPTVMFSEAQVTNLLPDLTRKIELPSPCPAGKFLQANGATLPPQVTCVDGTGAPLATSAQSGTVKTDVTEADPRVYTKATADSLLAGKASTTHTHAAADTTSGVFDPARLPTPTATTLGGAKSGSCSGTDKVTGISVAGSLTCGADQMGGGSGSQHQVNGTNLASNDPINFEDTSTVAFSNPSAGNIRGDVKDSSITAAKLSASSPTTTQLNGIGDSNIAAGALSPNRISGTAEVVSNKGAANGYASLDASAKVVQDPANAQTTAAASKIPKADGSGKIADGWLSANVTLLGQTIEDAELASSYSGVGSCTNQFVRAVNHNSAPACATVAGSDIADDAVTDTKLRNSAATSVIGRSVGTSGDPADIAAGSDGHFLRRSGGTLGFGAIVAADVPAMDAESNVNITLTSKVWLEAAACQNTTATLMWDTPTTNPAVAACVTGANTQKGVADFADGVNALSMQRSLMLPADWTGNLDVKFRWFSGSTTGNVVWQIAAICTADAETDDTAFATASTVTDTAKGIANQLNDASITGWNVVTNGGCAAGELLHVKVFRDPAHASDTLAATARLIGLELTLRRAQ